MKEIRARARVDPEQAPAFFSLLANTPAVEEARVVDVNTTIEGMENMLLAIDGDPTAFAAEARETPGVESVTLAGTDRDRSYALLVMRPLETPLFGMLHRASPAAGMVLRTPILYRDGGMYGRAVGDTDAMQAALSDLPDALDVRLDEIGQFRGSLDDPGTLLSERQREAVEAALELGYYDQPRGATHADVADRIGCAPATASDHLQKAEAKLVRASMDELAPES